MLLGAASVVTDEPAYSWLGLEAEGDAYFTSSVLFCFEKFLLFCFSQDFITLCLMEIDGLPVRCPSQGLSSLETPKIEKLLRWDVWCQAVNFDAILPCGVDRTV